MQPTPQNELIKSYLDLKDFRAQLDSPQNPDEKSEIEGKIQRTFNQILLFLATFTESNSSLKQLIIGLKVSQKQDHQIYQTVPRCFEIFFRIYRLERQIDDLKSSKTVEVAKDLLKQITHNIKELVTHHHEKPLKAYDWSYISSLVERLDIPLFLQRNDAKRHLEQGILQGLHLVKQKCIILTCLYEKICIAEDEADSETLKESAKQAFSEMLVLLEQQDLSIKKLVTRLVELPLFFEQNQALYEFFDKRPEKECFALRLERLAGQLTRYKACANSNSDFVSDLYKQINEAVLFFAEHDSINQLEQDVKEKILTLLYESRVILADPDDLLKPERCFLIQLENVRELASDRINKEPLHKRPPFIDLLLEFQKITQKFHENKIGYSNWVNTCTRIFGSLELHNECLYAFLTASLIIDIDLGLEFIKNWLRFIKSISPMTFSTLVPYPLTLILNQNKHPLLEDFVVRFKALITAFKADPDNSWNELCSFFIGHEECAKRISTLSFSSYHAREEITLFLANCYALHTTFKKEESKERSQFLYSILRLIPERSFSIDKLRPSLVEIKVEAPHNFETVLLFEALNKSDSSPTKTDAKIERFYLLLNRGIHLHANGKFPPQVFVSLEEIYTELIELYADRKLTTTLASGKIDETDRWRQICNAVIESRTILGPEYYDKLKQKAIDSPRRSLHLGERFWGYLSPENIAIIASWFKDKIHDGNRPWKRKKYQVVIEALQRELGQRKTQIEEWLSDIHNPEDFQGKTLLLLNKINTKITEELDREAVKVQHAEIMLSLREIVDAELFTLHESNLHTLNHTVGCVHLLIELCLMRMNVNMYDYLKELIHDMTELGLKALECVEPLYGFYLAENNYLLLDHEIQHLAIKTVPQEEKAPELALWYNRYQSLRGHKYDPHVQGGNLPFIIGSLFDKEGRAITNIRSGTPTTQKNKVAVINPEFEVLVRERRVLYINLQKPISGTFDTQGERSDALGFLGKKYPNNAFIVGMCPNTDWMHQKGNYEDKGVPVFKTFREFKTAAFASLYDLNSGYYFPKNWRIDGVFEEELNTIWDRVHDIFFDKKEVLVTLDRRMFNLAFNLTLIDHLLDKVKANTLIAACNHGADRAGVYNASFMKMLYILTGKNGEEYDEYLSVLSQAASMIVNKDAMNHNIYTLLDFMKLLKDKGVQKRLLANKDKFNIRDIKLPFEKKEDPESSNDVVVSNEPASAAAKPLD